MKRSLPPRSAGFRHLVDSTANSLRGIRDAFRTAAAFRQECALLVLHYAVFLILALIAGLWIAACVCVLRG